MVIRDGPYSTYCQTFPNGKMYVGITSQDPERRWRKGKGYSEGSFVRNAIEKYGWENIEKEIIASNQTEEEAKNFKRLLIKNLSQMDSKFGYNLTSGGEMVPGYCYSEAARKKMSKKKKGVFDGGNNPHAKPVVCIETGEIFQTAREASKHLGFGRSAVSCAITKGKGVGLCGGFHWRHATQAEAPKKRKKKEHVKVDLRNSPCSRPVYCIELDWVFPSVVQASRELHCSQCAINYSAKGKTKNPQGYHWRYVDEMIEEETIDNDSVTES